MEQMQGLTHDCKTYAVLTQGILSVDGQIDVLGVCPVNLWSDGQDGEDCSWPWTDPYLWLQLQTLKSVDQNKREAEC